MLSKDHKMAVTMVAIFGYPRSLTYRRKSLFISVVRFYLRACNKVLSGTSRSCSWWNKIHFSDLELSDCNLCRTRTKNWFRKFLFWPGRNMTSRAETFLVLVSKKMNSLVNGHRVETLEGHSWKFHEILCNRWRYCPCLLTRTATPNNWWGGSGRY